MKYPKSRFLKIRPGPRVLSPSKSALLSLLCIASAWCRSKRIGDQSLRVRIGGWVVLWALTLLYLWIEIKGYVGFLFLSCSFSFLLKHIVVAMVVSKIFIPICVMPQPLLSTLYLYLSEKPNLWTICLISGEGLELKLFLVLELKEWEW